MRQKKSFNNKDFIRTNGKINASEVRLIDENGEMVGVHPIAEALRRSDEAGLDLVEISPNADPPVCKIIDYGKYSYQAEKKKKEAKKHQKVVHLKEIKMRPKTDVHDYNFKVKHAKQFLAHGDRVKITIRFKGREMAYIDSGREMIDKVLNDTADIAKPEASAKMEGRNLSLILVPVKNKSD